MSETTAIEIQVGEKRFEAEVGSFSTLSKILENGEVPAVVREKKYHLLYYWTGDKWVFQKILEQPREAATDEAVVTCKNPERYPHNATSEELDVEEKSEEEIIKEYCQIKGVGSATAKRAYEKFGRVTNVDFEELKKLKGWGTKNTENVKRHVQNL